MRTRLATVPLALADLSPARRQLAWSTAPGAGTHSLVITVVSGRFDLDAIATQQDTPAR